MAKRIFSLVSFLLACLLLLAALGFGIYSFYDIRTEVQRLAEIHASGSDYLGVYIGVFFTGFVLFILSVFGAPASILSGILSEKKAIKCIALCLTVFFGLLLFAGFFLILYR